MATTMSREATAAGPLMRFMTRGGAAWALGLKAWLGTRWLGRRITAFWVACLTTVVIKVLRELTRVQDRLRLVGFCSVACALDDTSSLQPPPDRLR